MWDKFGTNSWYISQMQRNDFNSVTGHDGSRSQILSVIYVDSRGRVDRDGVKVELKNEAGQVHCG